VPNDQVVVIQKGKKDGEPCVITVNCPDKTELGYDLCIIILVFRFCTTKRDVSTDGKWCYVMFWVVSDPGLSNGTFTHKTEINDTCQRLYLVLGESCISCELQSIGPEFESLQQRTCALSPSIAEELFM
ncbi:hypothetical protein GIB67_037338, partial [Kingdonia uniflora]